MTVEQPNIVYGRLLESAHLSGYGFERMTDRLEWLLDGDAWQQVGPGYSDVNEFLRSVDLSAFNIAGKDRLNRRIKALQPTASNYAIGAATGTPESTVRLHLSQGAQNCASSDDDDEHEQRQGDDPTQNCAAEPVAPHVTQNSGEVEWYTPSTIIEAARLVLGDIDLDPASSPLANRTVRAERFYTVDDDGLSRPWAGRVWMNPPYSTGLVERFVLRAVEEFDAGTVTAAVVLTNNATDTRWWQRLAGAAAVVCFPARRIRFIAPAGEKNTPLQGQTIAYLGSDADRFATAFSALGSVR